MFGLQSTTARRGLLTAAEEIELARAIDAARAADERIQAGEQEPGDRQLVRAGAEAKTRFIESNLRLVISIAAQFKVGSHVDRDDLIQDGMLGLDKAVERFDPDKGFRFSTYATWWIRQSIQRGLEVTGSSIRIPAHRASELRMLGDAEPELHSPLASAAAARYVDSLDRPVGESGDPLGSLAPDLDTDTEVDALQSLDHDELRDLLAELDPATQFAISARFGLNGGYEATYPEIATALGIGAEAARRRVLRGLARLKDALEPVAA